MLCVFPLSSICINLLLSYKQKQCWNTKCREGSTISNSLLGFFFLIRGFIKALPFICTPSNSYKNIYHSILQSDQIWTVLEVSGELVLQNTQLSFSHQKKMLFSWLNSQQYSKNSTQFVCMSMSTLEMNDRCSYKA